MTRRCIPMLGALLLAASLGVGAQSPSAGDVGSPSGQRLPSDIPFKHDPAPAMAGEGSAVLAWGFVVTVAFLAVLFARRRGARAKALRPGWLALLGAGPGQSKIAPEILSRTRLTPRHTVVVVRWEGEQYLMACTDQGVQLLAQRTVSVEAAPQGGTS